MTQRKLFVGALVLTLAIGSLLYVSNQRQQPEAAVKFKPQNCLTPKYAKQHKAKCGAISPTPSAAPTLAPTPPATEPPDNQTATPLPAVSPIAYGQTITLLQAPSSAGTYPRPLPTPSANPVRLDSLADVPAAPKTWTRFFDQEFPDVAGEKKVLWHRFLLIKRGQATFQESAITRPIRGFSASKKEAINTNYLISDLFATNADQTTQWLTLQMDYKASNANKLKLAYRITDDERTDDPNASDWVEVPLTYSRTKLQSVKHQLNQTGKYLQYKIHLVGPDSRVENIGIHAQPVAAAVPSPSTPPASPSPETSASPAPGGEGHLTIMTKYIIGEETATAPPASSGPVLPSTNPTPLIPDNPTNPCENQSTDAAANVPLDVKLIDTAQPDPINLTSQQTDEDGRWQGLDGEIDSFPTGTYEISFGDWQRTDFRLVAFCDPQNRHLLQTRSNPTNRRATVVVRAGQTSQLIALFALRTNPYVMMNKFAVPLTPGSDGKLKVLRLVFPGLRFNYLIKYENTGGEIAKDVVIRDVIPAELDVADVDDDTLRLAPDARGGTLMTKTIGDLTVGQKGSFVIPVTLKADAFTSFGVLAP